MKSKQELRGRTRPPKFEVSIAAEFPAICMPGFWNKKDVDRSLVRQIIIDALQLHKSRIRGYWYHRHVAGTGSSSIDTILSALFGFITFLRNVWWWHNIMKIHSITASDSSLAMGTLRRFFCGVIRSRLPRRRRRRLEGIKHVYLYCIR
jgi:hypothetical protein